MSDLIRREDVVAVLCFSQETGQMVCGDLRKLLEEIKAIPSVEPERKKGRWIYDTERVMRDGRINRQYHCSVCGDQEFTLYNFCPNCGADMRGKND